MARKRREAPAAAAETAPKITLEKIVTESSDYLYTNLPKKWLLQDAKAFAKGKELYYYQQNALERAASVLYLSFFAQNGAGGPDFMGIEAEYKKLIATVPGPLNRACFWMATGSGKTLVLVKTMEHIDYLMAQGLIPKKEIMILLPKEDLIGQLKNEVKDYNRDHSGGRTISLVDLAEYEEDKGQTTLSDEIKAYYYRSDLLRDQKKETILDYRTYENGGNWYVFLDEAHRGDSENSNLKEYVNKLSANGFLFNFSATFTDDIDIVTTAYNFNLEKFINSGFGKNIYLSASRFTLGRETTEFGEREKQKQVLKSFLVYTVVAKSRKTGTYHTPLIMTLVNSVHDRDKGKNSDLKLFCNYMLRIAENDASLSDLLKAAQEELTAEFSSGVKYVFGTERLTIPSAHLASITLEEIREQVFNSKKAGRLEYYEGVAGKEIIFKLQTSSAPFALIRIGDTGAFIKNYLNGYGKLTTFARREWFRELNSPASTIKVLLGSRAFYEGWDSNRPNIINLINIGSGEAKKFVPQSVGRGIRIQPNPSVGDRKRLRQGDADKNRLLETLFIFSSDVKSVDAILSAMKELSGSSGNAGCRVNLFQEAPGLFQVAKRPFELLLPVYKDDEKASKTRGSYYIEGGCRVRLTEVVNEMTPAAFLLSSCRSYADDWNVEQYLALKNFMSEGAFSDDNTREYHDLAYLISDLRRHLALKEKYVDGVRAVRENEPDEEDNDIVHFKHIEAELDEADRRKFVDTITPVANFGRLTKEQVAAQCPLDTDRATDLDYLAEYMARIVKLAGKRSDEFTANGQSVHIQNSTRHYYLPLLYSETESIDWISHVIRQDSERRFIKHLLEYVEETKIESDWMFCKIDETLDRHIGMPYFADSQMKHFFPDFIFWIKKGDDYRIVFVDPKGSAHTDYERKVDYFEKLFAGRSFAFGSYRVTFDLKLVGDYQGGAKYAPYWIGQNDFSWLK